jgi:hypothetical protein
MARRTSSIVVSILVVLGVSFGFLAVVVCPRLYREGEALLAPIVELAGAEEAVGELNRELGFAPPADGLVEEQRLLVYLDTWKDLQADYQKWQDLVGHMEGRRQQSWSEAKQALAATRDLHRAQLDILRSRGMSPAELIWLDDVVLAGWWQRLGRLRSGTDPDGSSGSLRRSAEEDLRFVSDLERRHGDSPALEAIRERLRTRLEALGATAMPELPDLPLANQRLFWQQHDRIAEIGDPSRYPLHALLRGKGDRPAAPSASVTERQDQEER